MFTVSEVISDRAAWIVIHDDVDGEVGRMIGRQPVPEGHSENVIVTVVAAYATRDLHVLLYEDAGKPGIFEEGIDTPMLSHGKPITAEFSQIVQ
jgi:hypothetical protein